MAARPTIPNWSTPNLNKPEEYSSEFVQDGNRYAVVVNVATGQRQLYYAKPFGGSRSLLQSTNADGTIVPPNEQTQRNLDEFKRSKGGDEALKKALDTTRKQSFFIIEKASTPEEKEQLSKTKEYRGFKYSKEDPSVGASTVISFDVVPSKNSPFPKGSPPGHYPINIKETDQDRIKFQAVQLSTRTIYNPLEYESVAAPVFISMQGPIVDQNLVKWGESRVNGGEGVAASIGLDLMGKDGGGLTDAGKKAQELLPNIPEATAALASGNIDIFTRLTQNVFNPNLELIFKEPQLRPFNFNFKMSARGADEAKEIKKIIRYFKYHMAPKGKGGQLFLKTPDVFWIEYQKGKSDEKGEGGKLHPSLNLIAPEDAGKKACALQNMSVNYTPLGTYMTYDDEEATIVQYDISLSFQEITPVYQSDYEEGPGENHLIGY